MEQDPGPGAGPSPSKTPWTIAIIAVVALLLIGGLVLVLRGGGSDEGATTGTTTGATTGTTVRTGTSLSATTASRPTTTTTRAPTASSSTASTTSSTPSGPSSSISDPYDIVCTPADLLAAIDPASLGQGATVTTDACAPATTGSAVDAYAWSRVESPGLEPLVVLYSGTAQGSDSPHVMRWSVLRLGTAVLCEDAIPAQTCDLLTGVPRR